MMTKSRKASARLLLHVNPNGNVDVQNSVKTKLDTQTTFITTATSWREVIAMCDVEGYDNVVVRFGESIRPHILRYMERFDND